MSLPEIDYRATFAADPRLAELYLYQREVLDRTVARNRWIPITPFPKQALFLASPMYELLYGGSLAGGKTSAMLAAAAQYVDRPHYRALLIRETIAELEMPGALIEKSKQWWGGTAAKYNANLHRWKFPSGAEIWFGYLNDKAWKRYQSSEWDFIGYDELVAIPETSYRLLSGRVRKSNAHRDLFDVPPRLRGASNPPTPSQEATGWWVKTRFVDRGWPYFIQSKFEDNPYVDDDYVERQREMYDPVTFAKLMSGDWHLRVSGTLFQREMFGEPLLRLPRLPILSASRGWDLAATKPHPGNWDPDWTRGIRVVRLQDGDFYVTDMTSLRDEPGPVANLIKGTTIMDGFGTKPVIEQQPAAAGKDQRETYEAILAKYQPEFVAATQTKGGKIGRATGVSIACHNHRVRVVDGAWNEDFFVELEGVPDGRHDDIMDALAIGFNHCAQSMIVGEALSQWQELLRYRPHIA